MCSNALIVRRQAIEERVLNGLKERLMAPELVAVFVEEFNAELRRIGEAAANERAGLQRTQAEAVRKIAGILRAIEDGAYNPTLTKRLTALEAEKAATEAKLTEIAVPPVLRLHPNLPALYRSKVERLAEALGEPATAPEAAEILRSLIDCIVLTPAGDDLRIELHGDLATLAAFAERETGNRKGPTSCEAGLVLSVVAGVGFEPTTFRL